MSRRIKIDNASSKYKKQSHKRDKRIIRCSILIVCEGTKTEPNYFKSFTMLQQGIFVYEVEVKGIGRGTTEVLDKAIFLKKRNRYDRVWAVFDKDDFTSNDFNAAIIRGKNNGISVAWSNEAFELWYLYHFQNVITGVSRNDYQDKISAAVNASTKYKAKNKYKYAKNDPANFRIVTTYGSVDDAIKFAERKHKEYLDECYATHNPCTTVYMLVRQLLGQDDELNAELMESR